MYINPIILPALRRAPVLQWLGIRAEESAKRAKDPRFNRHDSGCYLWRPILRWKIEQVWEIHRRHNLKPNPLYSMGFNRVGCFPCVNCGKHEVRLIAQLFPEHIDKIREWEDFVSSCSKRGISTFFVAMTDPTDSDRPGTYSRIDKIVEWSKTGRGGRGYQLFFEEQSGGGCTSDMALCES